MFCKLKQPCSIYIVLSLYYLIHRYICTDMLKESKHRENLTEKLRTLDFHFPSMPVNDTHRHSNHTSTDAGCLSH